MTKLFLDLHVLQTVPPSNVNRDDTGSPKSAMFGGSRRARVSSQAWKRAVRLDFQEYLSADKLGVRSKRLIERIGKGIETHAPELGEQSEELAQKLLDKLGLKAEKPARKTKGKESDEDEEDPSAELQYLVFLSNQQINNLAKYAATTAQAGEEPTKKEAAAIAKIDHSIDIALFGRMVADLTDLKVDAAAQVAHAISVHPVETEFDYFTAVDDIENDAHAGAGMIGTVEFNSSTLYRYATVNVPALLKTLGDEAALTEAVEAFIISFVRSMPTGKQNTFAHRTLPHAVVATLRTDQPINLVGAFEAPARATSGVTVLRAAASQLAEHAQRLDEMYLAPGTDAPKQWVVTAHTDAEPLTALGDHVPMADLLSGVREVVAATVSSS